MSGRPRKPSKISAREAAIEISAAIDPPLARRLGKGRRIAELPTDLTREEALAYQAALESSGVEEAFSWFGWAVNFDRPKKRSGGRKGAPSRDWLREATRDLHALVAAKIGKERNQRRALSVVAYLVLANQVDQHRVFWRADGSLPPRGREALRWIAERLGSFIDHGEGQYEARRAKSQPQSPSSSASSARAPSKSPASSRSIAA